ncbi:hypothetical protein SGI36_09990 [Providencia rettgeri]|uniref:hypothetical protein n=1 Tax=Providencia TaxID=586 RepID=UPI001B36276D|nr:MULTISPECIES: hypothetical protein [Providencia]MBQ0528515.1 hypothetical protein [Providencia rettgeri]WOB87796.1 hypothetical protein P3L40_07885 [Providencia sp. PROV040]
MVAVINFEYLISPILCDSSIFSKIVKNVRLLSELFSAGIPIAFIEEDIIIKMSEHKLFPSQNIYQRIISQLDEDISICSSDLVRMINIILTHSKEFDSSFISHEVEWDSEVVFSPDFCYISDVRFNELKSLYTNISIENHFSEMKFFPLYFNDQNPLCSQRISITGKVRNIYPDKDKVYPYQYNGSVNLFADIDDFFLKMDGFNLFKLAKTPLEMKLSFYIGTLKIINENNLDTNFSWDDFKVGASFIDSLKVSECYAEQQFSSTLYSIIINLLAKTNKSEVNPFYKSDSADEPRTLGHLTAYRTHVTKKGRALRLLFWKDMEADILIFANVGNKHELEILKP